jgi:magnesium transporter
MITGYLLNKEGQWSRHDAVDDLLDAWKQGARALWVDLEGKEREALETLAPVLELTPDAISDAYEGDQRPRIDEYPEHLFLLIYGVLGPEPELAFGGRKLGIFFDEKILVTVHREPLRTLRQVHRRMDRNARIYLKRGTDFLLYAILDGVVDNYLAYTERVGDQLDVLEDISLDPNCESGILSELSDIRSDLLETRKMLGALREVVLPMKHGEVEHIDDRLRNRFQHVFDHIIQAQEEVEGLREMIHGIRDNYFAMVNERTNQFIKTLTIFATFMLPLSFIAGLYGMNVPLWPNPDSPWTTVIVVGGMVALTIGMVLFFHRKRWL